MRQLTIKRQDFEEAFELGSLDATAYLDLETGTVLIIAEDGWSILDGTTDPQERREIARKIEKELYDRYLPIPTQDSRTDYRDMERFVDTVEDSAVRELLETAIQGKGAFRRFKSALARHPEIEERWFAFRDARIQARMLNWFEMQQIEATLV